MRRTMTALTDAANTGLRFVGQTSFQVKESRILISLDGIESLRNLGNLSGTLSLEMWALNAPLKGVEFEGFQLAATQIGELHGQHLLPDCRYDLIFTQPPVGTWVFALMLREWDEGAFVVRDWVNFDIPYVVDVEPIDPSLPTPDAFAVDIQQPAANESDQPAGAKPPKPTNAKKHDIHLNLATEAELLKLKGVSKKLAARLIQERPFKSYKKLLAVKGVGPKLLEKLRKQAKL